MTTPGSAEASYYTWVDQFNTFGLGRNVPVNTGNESEGLLALKDGKFVILRVPPACRSLGAGRYPLGFYTKWMDDRIDNPDAGWKGRGLWACMVCVYRAKNRWLSDPAPTLACIHIIQARPDSSQDAPARLSNPNAESARHGFTAAGVTVAVCVAAMIPHRALKPGDQSRLGQRTRRGEDHRMLGLKIPEFFKAHRLCSFDCHGG